MIYIIVIIAIIVLLLIPSGKKKNETVTGAMFGTVSKHLSVFNKGFSWAGGLRASTREMATKNLLLVAQTGAGKGSCVCIPSLFTLSRGNNSILVLDIGNENYNATSAFLAKRDYTVLKIDFSENSHGFNIFDWFKHVDDIDKTATVITNNASSPGTDNYWRDSGQIFFSMMMQYVYFYQPLEFRNMANVIFLIQTYSAEPQKIDRLFIKTDDRLLRAYKTFNSVPEKTRLSIVSSLLSMLKIFQSPAVSRVTARSDFHPSDFRTKKCVLYFSISLDKTNFLAPIATLMFEFLFQELLAKKPHKDSNFVYCILDEFTSMRFENISMVFSQCRKFNFGCMAIVQHTKMLELRYSKAEAHAILNNCVVKIYLQGQSVDTCQELQEVLGKTIIVDDRGNEKRKYLMEASDIRMCKDALIIIGAELPCRTTMSPYYKHFLYSQRAKLPPFEIIRESSLSEPPLIPLK